MQDSSPSAQRTADFVAFSGRVQAWGTQLSLDPLHKAQRLGYTNPDTYFRPSRADIVMLSVRSTDADIQLIYHQYTDLRGLHFQMRSSFQLPFGSSQTKVTCSSNHRCIDGFHFVSHRDPADLAEFAYKIVLHSTASCCISAQKRVYRYSYIDENINLDCGRSRERQTCVFAGIQPLLRPRSE